MSKVSKIVQLIINSGKELGKNNPLILGSATAFFTIFSIPPMIIIVVNALSIYFKSESLSVKFTKQISSTFGQETANQLESIAYNFSSMAGKPWITVAGSLFLIFVATNLFKIIKISFNQICNIRPKSGRNILHRLKNRGIALGIILLTGVLFLLSNFADGLLIIIRNQLESGLPAEGSYLILFLSKIVSFIFIGLWFLTIFRFIPDARIPWKALTIGSLATAVLFMIGKLALERFLVNSNIGNIFETSTSIVLVLLFIFYSSMIMYYGLTLTMMVSKEIDQPIEPRKNAEKYEIKTLKG